MILSKMISETGVLPLDAVRQALTAGLAAASPGSECSC